MHDHQPIYRGKGYRNDKNILKVSGEGSISARPDTAIVILGTITELQNLAKAQAENAEAISHVIESVLKMGIPRENIQTFDYRAEPQYRYEDGKQIFIGYKVTHLLKITIDRVDQTGRLVDSAVRNGSNTVNNIDFSVSNPLLYYNKALAVAVQNTMIKAQTIAGSLGVTLIKTPRQVIEESQAPKPIPFLSTAMVKGISTIPIETGKLTISAVVRAEYQYYY
ncbi:SIMPL domain-containing protein [Bacillus methanolicus]|uniref:26 kDa periplasmic immunogenic protein n=1 Tax=Bacillus methanolicus (strain MGA3 / ATCC 53907) TaxID=796606 RepID=I3EAD0_BACMM|nr:SIMPL domain-containing protein [Bacillus methanolicus]AIE60691.1 hypothetical protein BMMGA3_11475 [Bacillus methanolicus MGA3]EIJ83451.1 periplasmic immunogenic protein [Bacillus methanolicus MGA3]